MTQFEGSVSSRTDRIPLTFAGKTPNFYGFNEALDSNISSTAVKTRVTDLAIFGGPPAFDSALYVGRPNIGDRAALLERINDVLERNWLTNDGPCLKELEQRIRQLVDVRHCVALCNATIGLELTAKVLDLSGEVILPSFTFIATAHALRWLGITPVFCDVDPATQNLDPRRVEELITERTSAVIGVHVWGRPCDVDAIVDLTQRRGLKLLFDAAHAFGCSYKGRMIGGFGNAEIFSFHATKFINSFEGGAIVTNDDGLAAKLRLARNFGFAGLDRVACLGTNAKMPEACAAMGLNSIASMDTFIEINRRNYDQYKREIAILPGVSLVLYDDCERNNYQYIVLEIDNEAAGLNRDTVEEILWAENVLARRYFYPGCHRMEPYCSEQPEAGAHLPQTERLVRRVLCLPTGSAVTPKHISVICALIEFILQHAAAVQERYSTGPILRHAWRSGSTQTSPTEQSLRIS